jgi:hypothetical protein
MSFKEIGLVLLFLAAWIVLNRWVLPWFGISTCMSGSCGVDRRPAVGHEAPDRAGEHEAFSEGQALPDARAETDGAQSAENAAR